MNRKEILTIVLALTFAAVASGLIIATSNDNKPSEANNDHGSHESAPAPENAEDLTNQADVSIDIKDSAYSKRDIKVKKGTKVTWTNLDSVEQNAMLEHADSSHAHEAPEAGKVKPDVFAGPLLKTGESYSFTFNEVGTNPYHSAPHPDIQGSVTVIE